MAQRAVSTYQVGIESSTRQAISISMAADAELAARKGCNLHSDVPLASLLRLSRVSRVPLASLSLCICLLFGVAGARTRCSARGVMYVLERAM